MTVRIILAVCCGLMLVRSLAGAGRGNDIRARLIAHPPSIPVTQERLEAVAALDEWIMRPGSDGDPEIIAYYQDAVDRMLEIMEQERVDEGLRVFQLYSSSLVFQTPDMVFAIDLDQGPNRDLTITPEEEGVAFRMTDRQVARLAALVDVSFHTHRHEDHLDYELTRALLAAGKSVVVTADTVEMWRDQPWVDQLVVLHQTIDEPHEVGGLAVDVLEDHQWGNDEHTAGTPCNAWLITTPEGVSVLAKGDINCGLRLLGWLRMLKERGRSVDLFVGGPSFWRGVDCTREIDALFGPIWAPGHCWEFTHRPPEEPKGSCQTFVSMYRWVERRIDRGQVVPLTWGEYIDLPAPPHAAEG